MCGYPSTQGDLTLSATTPQPAVQQLSSKKVSTSIGRHLPLPSAPLQRLCDPVPGVGKTCLQVPGVLGTRTVGSWNCSLCGHRTHCGWALSTAAGVLLPDRFSGRGVHIHLEAVLLEVAAASQALVLTGKFKAWVQWSFSTIWTFPSQPCCPDLGNRMKQADFESLVTCMESSVKLDMSCGCICNAGTMGAAGWGGPAGKLDCCYASLWELNLSC